jgi:hypothetical protein
LGFAMLAMARTADLGRHFDVVSGICRHGSDGENRSDTENGRKVIFEHLLCLLHGVHAHVTQATFAESCPSSSDRQCRKDYRQVVRGIG